MALVAPFSRRKKKEMAAISFFLSSSSLPRPMKSTLMSYPKKISSALVCLAEGEGGGCKVGRNQS